MEDKHRYLTGVLFEDEEIDSDESSPTRFRSRIPRPLPKKYGNNGNMTDLQQQRHLTIQKTKEIEKRTLESATRSLKLLQETEEIGVRAAEELACQGEKLHNTNTRVDEIDSHLKKSQKDINGIKSVFYGFKNIISGKSRSPSPHKRHISHQKKSPKIGKSQFYGTIDHSSGTKESGNFNSPSTSLHSLDVQSSAVSPSSLQIDEILGANLEGIANHIAQLKELGVGFGREIDHQNELIDILQDKVERADTKIGRQNKDMDKILGK